MTRLYAQDTFLVRTKLISGLNKISGWHAMEEAMEEWIVCIHQAGSSILLYPVIQKCFNCLKRSFFVSLPVSTSFCITPSLLNLLVRFFKSFNFKLYITCFSLNSTWHWQLVCVIHKHTIVSFGLFFLLWTQPWTQLPLLLKISKHFIGGDKRLTNCESFSQHIKNKSSIHRDVSIQNEANPLIFFGINTVGSYQNCNTLPRNMVSPNQQN